MISPDTIVAVAIQSPEAMDRLGEALRNDLVLANPHLRRLAEFADDFLNKRRRLPASGDWEAWLLTVQEGMVRDGAKEQLGRVLAIDTREYDPAFFAESVMGELQRGAVEVARARLNSLQNVEPATFAALAEKVASVQLGQIQGLANLRDLDVWMAAVGDDERLPTGFPTLDRFIGGWGKELVLAFADSGVGKSMLLQNWGASAAVRGKNVLHITLELGLRPQIGRYYRQIAQATRADVTQQPAEVRSRLQQWFRFSHGEIYLLHQPAYQLDIAGLRRVIDRARRLFKDGRIDVLVLDYLDLLAPTTRGRSGGNAYEDLGRLTHESRALTTEFDLTVLTASQAVRRPQQANRLTQKDMGDSYKKVQGADILVSLVQTDAEEEVYQGRLGILKVRDSGGRGQEVGLYINREMSIISEIIHANTIALMRRLGHLPEQLQKVAA